MRPPNPSAIVGFMTQKFADVDEYVAFLPADVAALLGEVRARLHASVPGLAETISYHMPTFELDGRLLVHVAGWKRHVSLYPVPDGDDDLRRDLGPYLSGASTAKFPVGHQIPDGLVERYAAALLAQRLRR